jgi:hypothetical protein
MLPHPLFRAFLFEITLLATLALATPARADVQACVEAHSEAQLKRDESDFLTARELFGRCIENECPEPIRMECAALLSKLEESMPSVVLTAKDDRGNDVLNVKVELDGKPYLDALSGRATAVNPGSRRFVFLRPDGTRTTVTALILEGVKGRELVGRFSPTAHAPAAAQQPVTTGSGRETVAYVLGGAGMLALGAFGYFALSGKSELDHLRATCAPNCSDSKASAVSANYLLADISLIAAAGLLGGGAYLYFTAPSGPDAEQALGARFRGRF